VPNRYVREDAIESERVNALSWQGEVFYRRLINRVDDFGRYTANAGLLRASIFPLQIDKVSVADVAKLLLECEQSGLISTWKGELGKEYLALHTWKKERATTSKYPDPPADICKRLHTSVRKCSHPPTDAPDYDPDYDNDSDTDNARARVGRFAPPSIEEVAQYCQERRNGIDPEAFVAFYASKGWKVGGASMKDWKSPVITWEKRNRAEKPSVSVPDFV
jgi:hypothetical protein